jgi:tripartite-type tricarboxylate transporter receptor subunit TctC
MMVSRIGATGMIAACVLGLGAPALAQNYPDRTVEIVVPFSPGAVTDVLGRALAEAMSQQLGQRFIVVNKPGATGAIGAQQVARANPDGYQLMFTAAVSLTVLPLNNKTVGYDHKSFDPLCQTFKNEMVIIAAPNSRFKTVADIVKAAKEKPGGINYGHLGVASIPHLVMTEFSQVAGLEFNAIPFKGDSDVMQQVMAGHVEFGTVVLSSAAGSGLKLLGLFGEARNPSVPDVPTMKEQGFAIAPSSFGGLLGPANLPADVKRKLNDACKTAAQGELYAKLAKSIGQPLDYYADGPTFGQRLDQDVKDKARLLELIGKVK